jgi:polyisoprenyl-phosphate glycosyltransferase
MTRIPLELPLRVAVIIPVRDDWDSAAELIRRLDATIPASRYQFDVLFVDDCSRQGCSRANFQPAFVSVKNILVLRLRRNLGHQRAIAIGLVHVHKFVRCDAVLVMDGDGEDTPEGALQLLETFTGGAAIFARRSRRTESVFFRAFYQLYKVVHYLLTGVKVQVGNFSVLPAAYLSTLAVTSELWNHYSAAVIRSGLAMETTPIPRGHRIAGASKMNFVSLAAHGMSAISVYGDIVGVRLMVWSIAGSFFAAFGIASVLVLRFLGVGRVPGWATYASGALAIILIQFVTLGLSFTFIFLSNRINLTFIPLRDYELFVAGAERVWGND